MTDDDTTNPEIISASASVDTEVLLQYGNAENENGRFRSLLRYHKRAVESDPLSLFLCCAAPLFIADWIFSVAWLFQSTAIISAFNHMALRPDLFKDTHTLYQTIRNLWDFTFGVGASYVIMIAYIVRNTGGTLLYRPTHVGVSQNGLRMFWMRYLQMFVGRRLKWSAITGVALKKNKNKIGQEIKVLEIKSEKRTVRLDLRRFAREQDREYLARVLKLWLPEAAAGLEVQDVINLESYQPSYTRLWEQSLLTPQVRERRELLPPETELSEGRFRIIQRLGTGGQGTAYLAEATTDDAFEQQVSQVVLKEYVLPDLEKMHDRHRALTKLEKEVVLLSRLSHEGIARFIDVFVEDHRAYVVSEFVDGPSLRKKVDEEGPLSELQAVKLGIEMCDMLAYLHDLDPPVLHQDFTPENLILPAVGSLKLIDFNVARESITIKTGLVVGKQSYMPPEQFKGKATVQSDVFALGCTLYFLLTGIDPEPLTVARPSDKRSDLSKAIDSIVQKATALETEERYGHATELKEDLLQLLNDFLCPSETQVHQTSGSAHKLNIKQAEETCI